MPKPIETELLCLYMTLLDHFGPLNWWPADSPFEVVIGAILTQNTAWANVELAIANLKEEQVISPDKLADIPIDRLEELIKPSGFFRQKANRLQSLSRHLVTEWQSNLNAFAADRLMKPGIDYLPGPESARKPQILFFFTLYIGLHLSLMPIPDAFSSASESCKATRHMLRLERSLRRHSPKTLPSTTNITH